MSTIIQEWLRDDTDGDADTLIDFDGIADLAGTATPTIRWWATKRFAEEFPAPAASGWVHQKKRGPARSLFLTTEIAAFVQDMEEHKLIKVSHEKKAREIQEELRTVENEIARLQKKARDLQTRADNLNKK